jgi:hypothetical protein
MLFTSSIYKYSLSLSLSHTHTQLSITDLVNKAGKGVSYDVESTKEQQQRGTGREAASETTRTATKTKTIILERSALDGPGAVATNVGGISACANGDLDIARELRRAGWLPACAIDKHGNTALHWAAGAGHLQVVRWLLEEEKVNVQEANKQGRTAIMWAAKNGQVEVVEWMLHQAPLPRADLKACMKDGSRAWDWAVYGGHLPTLALLHSHPDVDIHALNHFGCGAAFWAAAGGNVSAPPPPIPVACGGVRKALDAQANVQRLALSRACMRTSCLASPH